MNNPASSVVPPQPAEDVWTVRRVLEWTTNHLKKHGSDTPRLDAEILLAFACNCSRIQLYTNFHEPMTELDRGRMKALVQRRVKAEPIAYLVGHREFFNLDFRVTSDVLVPRPDTETLVLALIEHGKARGPLRALDLCTGSGCIAIASAKNLPETTLVATDVSPAALAVARDNAEAHKVGERVEFREGDLFGALEPGSTFDVIASNPPYIPTGEIPTLDPDVRLHEPLLALEGGEDGLDFYRRIVPESLDWLKPGGLLLLEFSPEQADAVKSLADATGAFSEVAVIKDLAGRARVLKAVRRA